MALPAYGALYINNNTTSITLVNSNQYYPVKTNWIVGDSQSTTISAVTGSITVNATSQYVVICNLSFSPNNSASYTFSIFKNGVLYPSLMSGGFQGEGCGIVSISGIVSLVSGDTLNLYIKCNNDPKLVINIVNANFSIASLSGGGGTGGQGLQGSPGPTGSIGPAGAAGAVGPAGAAGAPGIQGPTGPAGAPQGSPGVTGPTGPIGATGIQGATGQAGFQGTNGPTGSQGLQGSPGVTGVTGPTGPQGATGPSGGPIGPTGSIGATGSIGSQGVQGSPGITGVTGPTGPAGNQGTQGIQGSPGITGATGTIGPQGIQGSPGITGATGPTGPQGNAGIQGSPGITGATGPTGAVGPQGIQGSPGITGTTGPTGPAGIQGIQGSPGITGVTGPAGNQGSPGITGATGVQGIQGSPGITGVTGPTGPAGNQGAQGIQGSPGITGATGPQGIQGSPGVTGATGPTGSIGPQGIQGSPGVTGVTGPTGSIGPQGIQGSPGITGATGPQGATGPTSQTLTITAPQVLWSPVTIFPNYSPITDTSESQTSGCEFSMIVAGDVITGVNVYWAGITSQTLKGSLWTSVGATRLASGTIAVSAAGVYAIPFSSPYTVLATDIEKPMFATVWETSGTTYSKISAGSFSNFPAEPFLGGPHLQWIGFKAFGVGDVYPGSTASSEIYIVEPIITQINQFVGITGPTGGQGIQGSPGITGATGPTGPAGIQGIQGSPGITGATGPTGPQGNIGIQGIQGSPGITGVTGPTGSIGPQGIQGSPGITGVTGPTGSIGPQGIQGSPGVTGATGPTGSIGQQGIQGSPGITGVTGPTGSIGIQGSTGNPGINAYSTSAGFSQPAVGAAIAIQVPSGYWIQTGQYVFIPSGGYYQVASGSVPTFSIKNLGYSGINIPVGSAISAAFVSPGGVAGVTGATGIQGPTGTAGSATVLAGDATGPVLSNQIWKLSGNPVVMNSSIQWGTAPTGVQPNIYQATAAVNAAPKNFIIAAQAPNNLATGPNSIPGNLVMQLANGSQSGSLQPPLLVVNQQGLASPNIIGLGLATATAAANKAALWFGSVELANPIIQNAALIGTKLETTLNVPTGQTLNISAGYIPIMSFNQQGMQPALSSIAITSTAQTLTASQVNNFMLVFTGTLTGATVITIPTASTNGLFFLDISALSGISITNTLQFQYGSATTGTISSIASSNSLYVIATGNNGANTLASNF